MRAMATRLPFGASLAHRGVGRRSCPPWKLSHSGGHRGLVTADKPKPLKRFYHDASSAPAEGNPSAWRVLLDGKSVKTPKGTLLELPSEALAQAVAYEWDRQGEQVLPREMPFTTIGCTAIDLVCPTNEDGVKGIASCIERMLPYLETDTTCFIDDHQPLAELQAKEWGPLRAWYEERFGVTVGVASGLAVPQHSEDMLVKIATDLATRSPWELCAMEIATNTAKSHIVAAALLDRDDVTADDALRWALLEEHFQIERWGLVEGEHDFNHKEIWTWFHSTQRFARMCRGTC